jgi:hypothetical protein
MLKAWFKPLLKVLLENWLGLFFIVACAAMAWNTARLKHDIARLEKEKAALISQYNADARQRAEATAAAFASQLARQQQTQLKLDQVAAELHTKTEALRQSQQNTEKRIPDAMVRDGNQFTGLGPDGLRLYVEAFGYPTHGSGGD